MPGIDTLRTVRWTIGTAVVDGLILLVLARLMSGFDLSGIGAAVAVAVGGLAVGALLWRAMHHVAVRLPAALFPVLAFAVTGAVVIVTTTLVNLIAPGAVTIEDFETALVVALLLTVANTVIGVLFGLDDQRMYDRYVTAQIRRLVGAGARTDVPGIVFIQLDGLAEPILRRALDDGYMPTLQRWLATGSHHLRGWEPDLSSQTSASQAGILLGSNEGIPAFRWWDKSADTLMVSNKLASARAIEGRLSTGRGLLVGGASRWNVFSGDAADTIGTYSKLGQGVTGGQISYVAYLSNPYSLARTVTLFVADVVREVVEASRQRVADVRPRVQRGFRYALVRAGTTVLLQEAAAFMLTADMYRGVPVVYSTFFGYDKVAHYAGSDRRDALKVLRSVDRVLAHLERVGADAPRPYHLVVLSDHGHSQGTPFRQRYGKSLAELVDELCETPRGVGDVGGGDEGLASVSTALDEAIRQDSSAMRLLRRLLRDRLSDGQLMLGTERRATDAAAIRAMHERDVIVVATGNLGLISFPRVEGRMTREQIDDAFPRLTPGLVAHEGISFVMMRSETGGAVVVGPRGMRFLEDGRVTGEDPLAPFGPNAARHLARTDGFATAPDILVMGRFDAETGEVAAFEEQIGSHGGLGGLQTRPFLIYPASLPLDLNRPIVGAGALHQILKSWVPLDGADADAVVAVEEAGRAAPASASPG